MHLPAVNTTSFKAPPTGSGNKNQRSDRHSLIYPTRLEEN